MKATNWLAPCTSELCEAFPTVMAQPPTTTAVAHHPFVLSISPRSQRATNALATRVSEPNCENHARSVAPAQVVTQQGGSGSHRCDDGLCSETKGGEIQYARHEDAADPNRREALVFVFVSFALEAHPESVADACEESQAETYEPQTTTLTLAGGKFISHQTWQSDSKGKAAVREKINKWAHRRFCKQSANVCDRLAVMGQWLILDRHIASF